MYIRQYDNNNSIFKIYNANFSEINASDKQPQFLYIQL